MHIRIQWNTPDTLATRQDGTAAKKVVFTPAAYDVFLSAEEVAEYGVPESVAQVEEGLFLLQASPALLRDQEDRAEVAPDRLTVAIRKELNRLIEAKNAQEPSP